MRLWIDIENPPQVQYLLPFKEAAEAEGIETIVTARDYGNTLELLGRAGLEPPTFGCRVGRSRPRKVLAVAERTRDLLRFFGTARRPDALLAASRAAPIAASRLGVASFLIVDYEHVHVSIYRLTHSTLLYPSVIDRHVFLRRGLNAHQLVPFAGLKEDLTFTGVDIDAVPPHDFGPTAESVHVLFRPPSETSQHSSKASLAMARATLGHLAAADAVVVLSPRSDEQRRLLEGLDWRRQPIILRRPVGFLSLLKGVDAVVCAGGTMLREAAYLGIPAYSIFRSRIGAVDRWLEEIGRARLLARPGDARQIQLERRGPLAPLRSNPGLLQQLLSLIIAGTRHQETPRVVPPVSKPRASSSPVVRDEHLEHARPR